jgi:proteasome lid subunit RPN8/RPN11
MRPIACEHARGPAFLLSDKDRVALNQQLTADAEDPHLEGLISVGWFLSHTRSEITLSDSDLELYSIFFPAPWQITLVVRPGRGGAMRAGFFVREADGTVKSESSYLEFNFPDRLAGVLDRSASSRVPGERRLNVMPRSDPLQNTAGVLAAARRELVQREVPVPTFGQPFSQRALGPSTQYLPSPPSKKKWPWLVGWAVVVILAAVFGLRYWLVRPVQEPISLSVAERDGQLHIEWNHAARPVTAATHGTLVINDGSSTQTFALSPRDLTAGNYTYERKTGDVEIRMSVEDSDGAKVQEASRFLGRPPVKIDQNELGDLKKKREELESEIQRLSRENRGQQEKIEQLQRTLHIMQARSAK